MRSTADGLRAPATISLPNRSIAILPHGGGSIVIADRQSPAASHVAEWIWNKIVVSRRRADVANVTQTRFACEPFPAPLMRRVSSGRLLPPSPPAEKAAAREDQTGQASTPKAKRLATTWPARSASIKPYGVSDDELTTASHQGEKTSASRYKTRQSRTYNRPRHCGRN
jgi:hypothetical protein